MLSVFLGSKKYFDNVFGLGQGSRGFPAHPTLYPKAQEKMIIS
jgi:hypothetical protein